jgi:AcrR family transcriptional regulator
MTGLRARNRVDRNLRIIKAATGLFRETGYEATKIDDIAAEADVAIGTIYNYYRNKGDILVAIVSMEVNEVLRAGRDIIAKPPAKVEKAVDVLFSAYFNHSLVYLNKDMWRQSMATSTHQPTSPFGKTYTALDRALSDQTCDLILTLQAKGKIRKDVDARSIGELLFNNQNNMFIEFVKNEYGARSDFCCGQSKLEGPSALKWDKELISHQVKLAPATRYTPANAAFAAARAVGSSTATK